MPSSGRASASPLAGIITQAGFLLRLEKRAALIADPDPVVPRLALRLRAGARPPAAPARQTRRRPPWFAVAGADLPNPHTREAWTVPPADTS